MTKKLTSLKQLVKAGSISLDKAIQYAEENNYNESIKKWLYNQKKQNRKGKKNVETIGQD